ncbi:MAG: DUF5110 domain-containing protein [Prevotella sp.]|nr:DUF5110 domain-containing protein [Prevotella sp.]
MINFRFLSAFMLLLASSAFAQKTEITYYAPNIVRVVKTPTAERVEKHSFVVTAQPQAGKKKEITVTEDNGRLTFCDAKGNVLMTEGDAAFTPVPSASTAAQAPATPAPSAAQATVPFGSPKGCYQVSQAFRLGSDEAIYGLGMLQNGKMNQRGENRRMMQSNLEDYAHFFQSIKGYGIYWDNYSPTHISDSADVLTLRSEVGEMVDYYFIYGGNADGVIKGMRWLTGKVPMQPLWTYGFHQSRERYRSWDELTDVIDRYRRDGIPFDGIIQDWQYWGSNYLWNAMEFGGEGFNHADRAIKHIHDADAHLSISIWAAFGPMTKPYAQLNEKGLLYSFETWPQSALPFWPPRMDYPSGARVYDPYSKEARDIYWNNLRRLHSAGCDAWWMDSTDPDHHSFKESDLDEMKPVTDPVTGVDKLQSWRSVRNLFPLATVEGVYQHQREADSTKRVFILTRSYFAGQQRTGAQSWSGDVSSSWDSFRKQIPLCLNHTLTANPNVNTDIGGFFASKYNKHYGDNSATRNPLYQELYVRWMQFGLFCPMMRSHGTEVYRELYYYGSPGEPVYDALLQAVKMRYRLLPYIYSQSWQVCHNDDSYMRALMMDFAADRNTWDNNREFMFGRSLLVAPVLNALYTPETANPTDPISGWDNSGKSLFQEGFKADWNAPKTYEVYLPKGAAWYDYWTGERLEGGQTVKADGTLMHSPLYVKAGSILPLCTKEVDHADIADWKYLDIIVYPGADAEFTLYEDEGDNYNYEKGRYSTITFKWNEHSRTLTIGKRLGDFAGMQKQRTFRVRLNTAGGEKKADAVKTIEYNGTTKRVKL